MNLRKYISLKGTNLSTKAAQLECIDKKMHYRFQSFSIKFFYISLAMCKKGHYFNK